jgi:Fis family transcriptional regulator
MRAAHKNQQQQEAAPMNVFQSLRVDAVTAPETAPALSECVARAVRRYLAHSGGDCAQDLYRLVLAEVEAPMLRETLRHTDGNLTRAADMLGITRATLRKKLAEHRLG